MLLLQEEEQSDCVTDGMASLCLTECQKSQQTAISSVHKDMNKLPDMTGSCENTDDTSNSSDSESDSSSSHNEFSYSEDENLTSNTDQTSLNF